MNSELCRIIGQVVPSLSIQLVNMRKKGRIRLYMECMPIIMLRVKHCLFESKRSKPSEKCCKYTQSGHTLHIRRTRIMVDGRSHDVFDCIARRLWNESPNEVVRLLPPAHPEQPTLIHLHPFNSGEVDEQCSSQCPRRDSSRSFQNLQRLRRLLAEEQWEANICTALLYARI